jgi:hypothetical protein
VKPHLTTGDVYEEGYDIVDNAPQWICNLEEGYDVVDNAPQWICNLEKPFMQNLSNARSLVHRLVKRTIKMQIWLRGPQDSPCNLLDNLFDVAASTNTLVTRNGDSSSGAVRKSN